MFLTSIPCEAIPEDIHLSQIKTTRWSEHKGGMKISTHPGCQCPWTDISPKVW